MSLMRGWAVNSSRFLAGAALLAVLGGCNRSDALTDSEYEAAADNLEAMSDNIGSMADNELDAANNETGPWRAYHRYLDEEDGVYSYVAAVSEEERKQGRVAGDIIRYGFRGVSDGAYRLVSVDEYGRPLSTFECEKPCRVIKHWSGGSLRRMPYDATSVIGAAFTDALNGRLKVLPEAPKANPAPSPSPALTVDPQSAPTDQEPGSAGEAAPDELGDDVNANWEAPSD